MGRGSRMNHQTLGVADVGQMTQQFDTINKLLACLHTALDTKSNNTTGAVGRVFLCVGVVGAPFQARVIDLGYFRASL